MTNFHLLYQELLQDTLQYLRDLDPSLLIATDDPKLFKTEFSQTDFVKDHAPKAPATKTALAPKEKISTPQVLPVKKEFSKKPEAAEKAPVKEITPIAKPEAPVAAPLFQAISSTLRKIIPELPILSEVPGDEEAKTIRALFKQTTRNVPICLLCPDCLPEELEMLQNLAKAIEVHFVPAKVVTFTELQISKTSVQDCKVLLANEESILQSILRSSYRKNITKKENFLFDLPVILMQKPAYYLANPLQKATLWKELCLMLAPFLSHP